MTRYPKKRNRRDFLKTASATAVGVTTPYWFTGQQARAFEHRSKNDRPVLGCIGTGDRWGAVGPQAMRYSDCVAVCDVDANHVARAKDRVSRQQTRAPEVHEDYRRVLDRKEIDIVTIVTPDHWHSKIAIEALKAGKDVYCEKPLTLTIDEGKMICKAVKETGRVFQVGTQQRSESPQFFLTAVALCHHGRLGKIERVECRIGGGDRGGPFNQTDPPPHLNWEKWLGQAPLVPYIKERCHYQFRWWYEYSGGKLTDWGAHHVDIAQWAINALDTGPISIEGTAKHQNIKNGYNTAIEFLISCKFNSGVEMVIRHDKDNGIFIAGDKGRIFVSRGSLKGKPMEDLKDHPLPDDAITRLYKGKKPGNHMGNFFECVKTREQPVSDVFTHHRALTTCHLANICIRLGRPLKWNPDTEQIEGDEEANAWQKREQRNGYEIVV